MFRRCKVSSSWGVPLFFSKPFSQAPSTLSQFFFESIYYNKANLAICEKPRAEEKKEETTCVNVCEKFTPYHFDDQNRYMNGWKVPVTEDHIEASLAELPTEEKKKETTWAYVREKLTSYHFDDYDRYVNGWKIPVTADHIEVPLSGNDYYSKGTGTYVGPVKEGFFEGAGRLYDSHSFCYGVFRKSRQVSGIRRFKDGTQYRGQLQDGLPHGWSSVLCRNKTVLKGIFKCGTFIRSGALKPVGITGHLNKRVHFDPDIG